MTQTVTKKEYKRLQIKSHQQTTKSIKHDGLQKLDGKIICIDCGKNAEHYDHRDYREPKKVVPVCKSCNLRRGPALPKIDKTSTDNNKFMRKLKRWIDKNGGVEKAAKLFKCSKTMIYYMLTGEKRPGLKLATKINRITNIPVKTLRPDLARYFK